MTQSILRAVQAARDSVTSEQRAGWDKGRDALVTDAVWYSSFWLCEQLTSAGCPPQLAEKITFAVGQRQAHEDTPDGIWGQTVIALRNYTERGRWEEPGEELAQKLLFENFGNPIDVEKLLLWIKSRPTNLRALTEMLSEMEATGQLPKKPKTPWEQP